MKIGDPALNPWLPVERSAVLRGLDEYGREKAETLNYEERPSYYFWLGKDAYAEPKLISHIIPIPVYRYMYQDYVRDFRLK